MAQDSRFVRTECETIRQSLNSHILAPLPWRGFSLPIPRISPGRGTVQSARSNRRLPEPSPAPAGLFFADPALGAELETHARDSQGGMRYDPLLDIRPIPTSPAPAGLFFAQAGARPSVVDASFPNDFVECVSVASVIVVAPIPGRGPASEHLRLRLASALGVPLWRVLKEAEEPSGKSLS